MIEQPYLCGREPLPETTPAGDALEKLDKVIEEWEQISYAADCEPTLKELDEEMDTWHRRLIEAAEEVKQAYQQQQTHQQAVRHACQRTGWRRAGVCGAVCGAKEPPSSLQPIFTVEMDTALRKLHPELATVVESWLQWYRDDPLEAPPISTADLCETCKGVLEDQRVEVPKPG